MLLLFTYMFKKKNDYFYKKKMKIFLSKIDIF